ncbi:hypothetical protein [Thioalkalivibrio sp.]|uniref:hypothetical protein n=1 Tax=Thioalkalivibrio sp. TaxID=2093813 RepID=UPI003562D2A0
MTPWLQIPLLFVLSLGFAGLALMTSFRVHRRLLEDAGTLSALGARLGMRYRVLGAPYLSLPEPFVVHERPGTAAENSLAERSLVSSGTGGLPAVFEYATYRDGRGLRRAAAPFVVLAAQVSTELPAFRLRPRWWLDKLLGSRIGGAIARRLPDAWVLHRDAALLPDEWKDRLDWRLLQASGLWIQVSGSTVYLALPPRIGSPSGFCVGAIEELGRRAIPLLWHLGSPDATRLQRLVRMQAFNALPARN